MPKKINNFYMCQACKGAINKQDHRLLNGKRPLNCLICFVRFVDLNRSYKRIFRGQEQKSCPKCSVFMGKKVFHPLINFGQRYGGTQPQSNCFQCAGPNWYDGKNGITNPRNTNSFLYFAINTNEVKKRVIKVGHSKDPKRRLKEIRYRFADDDFSLLYAVKHDKAKDFETDVKKALKTHRAAGYEGSEYFYFNDEVIKFLGTRSYLDWEGKIK